MPPDETNGVEAADDEVDNAVRPTIVTFKLGSPMAALTAAMNAAMELALDKEVAFTLLITCDTRNVARDCPLEVVDGPEVSIGTPIGAFDELVDAACGFFVGPNEGPCEGFTTGCNDGRLVDGITGFLDGTVPGVVFGANEFSIVDSTVGSMDGSIVG